MKNIGAQHSDELVDSIKEGYESVRETCDFSKVATLNATEELRLAL